MRNRIALQNGAYGIQEVMLTSLWRATTEFAPLVIDATSIPNTFRTNDNRFGRDRRTASSREYLPWVHQDSPR